MARADLDLADDWSHLIVEAAPNAIVMVGPDGRIALVNQVAELLFGYTRAELIGEPVALLVPERFRHQHSAHLQEFLGDPQARAMGAGRELFGVRKDGSEVPIEIGLAPIETPRGRLVLASVIDISERRRAEVALRRSEERLQLVVEASPTGLVMTGPAGRILLVNAQIEALFGYRRTELLGQPVEVLVPARFRGAHPAHREAFLREPSSRAMGAGRDLFGLRKDGSEFPVEIGLNPIDGPEGVVVMASVIDITQRKRSEDELRRSNADLEQFAYIASHDLQEPLRMVASYTELLARRYQGRLDEQADTYIHFAADGARRMQQLVIDLLAFSRVGSQGKPLQPVSAGQVLERVLRVLASALDALDAQVEASPLPTVMADEGQLHQLFQNLLGNAVKFHGSEPLRVRIHAEAQGDRWLFSVQDNGIGIDERFGERIFQMFQRLHARGEYDGSGIGLAIAKRIVERHGGRIWLSSSPGVGSTFYFTLPAAGARLRA